ncbi:MAG: Ig-like domain-containing protein [Gemmatimonas sp.]
MRSHIRVLNPRLLRTRLGALIALGLTAVLGACGGGDPVRPVAVGNVSITLPGSDFHAGTTYQLSAVVTGADNSILTDRTVTWAINNSAVAQISQTGLLTTIAAGAITVSATAESKIGVATITVAPPPVASVSLTLPSPTLYVGATVQAALTLRDVAGNVLTGRTVNWSSSNSQSATVSPAGLVTSVAPGSTLITAASEGKSASFALEVQLPPVASVTVAPATNILTAGETQQLTATLRDAQGNTLTGRTIAWASSNAAIATVSSTGLVTTVAAGNVTISATSEGQSGTATFAIAANANAPLITSVTPATLVPGSTATIAGLRFDPLVARNSVLVKGVGATVLTATATQITFTVPCVNSGSSAIVVTSAGVNSPAFTHPLATTARTLGVGQSVVITNNAASLCNELVTASPTARYLVAVFSASTSQNNLTNFEIAGNTTVTADAVRVTAPAVAPHMAADRELSDNAAEDAQHFQMLERDRQQYVQSRAKAARLGISATASADGRAALQAPVPTLGELRDFFFTYNSGCNSTGTVMRSKAIYVGTRAVIWEDTNNTLQSSVDAALLGYYQRLGQIFDQDQYDAVRDNFGDPLLRDAVTDNDGRIHMVFSSRLNATGAAAYVTSCDQFPRTVNEGSNFGEFFYGQVPTLSGSSINNPAYPDGWFYFMARTVVHEVKHIASHAARVANGAPAFEQSWLEEGTARHAEEVWVRKYLHKVEWKANTGWGTAATNGVFCDFHPLDATCNANDPLRRPSYGVRRQFNELRDKLVAPWDWSPYGDGSSQSGSVFYQTTWSLVRYAIDRYGASDAAFLRALNSSSTNGVTNLSAVAGVSIDELIGAWGLALYADDYPGLTPLNPDLQFQTWNFRSIYAGLNAAVSWNVRFPTVFPIAPVQLGFGAFTSTRTGLRGGAHSYYEISGSTVANQLIQLKSTTAGAAPSSNLRIAIARLQ